MGFPRPGGDYSGAPWEISESERDIMMKMFLKALDDENRLGKAKKDPPPTEEEVAEAIESIRRAVNG